MLKRNLIYTCVVARCDRGAKKGACDGCAREANVKA